MNTCQRKAYAKINLGLDVLGTLPNGYHEVKMIMQTVDIWDVLSFEKTETGIVITTDSGELPTDENNLIYKAARLMQEEFDIGGGVRIHLQKHIPIAAGMAGGSTDAAATMRGLNELYDLNVPEEKLMELGVRIGADVPYCIMGGTALAEGIGERLTRLPAAPECFLVVAKPDYNVSTKEIYEKLDALKDYAHPDIDGIVDAIKLGNLAGVAERLGNVLEDVTVQMHPAVTAVRELLEAKGALGSRMSGSGPTVFGIFDNQAAAETAAESLKAMPDVKQIFVTRFV
jgi:4-diphosphocytidyl-2-C-methyl-D-erythritol kinase